MKRLDPIRVAYVNHTGAVSGAEKVLLNMLRGLDRNVYEPVVICPENGDLPLIVKAENIACEPMPLIQARFSWRPSDLWRAITSLTRAIGALRRILSLIEPDIVHANGLRAGIAASMASVGTRRKIVWHIHDNLPRHPISTLLRVAALALHPARIVAVSDSTAKAFCGPFSFEGAISTIHNGVDLAQFPPKGEDRELKRAALGIPEESFVVCAVGQICARKGLIELVQAVEIAHAEAPELRLVIAGSVVFEHEKEYFRRLQSATQASAARGNVHFTGQVQNVSALLQSADLLVLNSHEEPFGLVLIEAMSSGTPVLATRAGGIPEIVKDSENGWLIDKADTPGLARKLVELAKNKEELKRVSRHAREVTCPQFSLARFQGRLHNFYAELLPVETNSAGRPEWASPYRSMRP
jgi:glycosyltransferase involved in cell wall biosynthesis